MENGGVGGGGDVPENGNDHFLGTQSESAGKSEACAGCPNQQICASAPKGPDPVGIFCRPLLQSPLVSITAKMGNIDPQG
ncbi:cytosolic Fe-S cluster assembly factor NBP35-like isoform X4 [Phragmites australis]|uniref:cytosolic Fe-S cluster assembly factor NBP35-like isoform X4 n=1 Tax=Phragmites australis TaxID=29695 RepID=UPI002D7A212F|nr:cytosolic Fe-S cluster assembly factor NBP35-like isoform X4 [Phragmites australis]